MCPSNSSRKLRDNRKLEKRLRSRACRQSGRPVFHTGAMVWKKKKKKLQKRKLKIFGKNTFHGDKQSNRGNVE